MQQGRLEGWMVRQIENADMAKETVIQLPVPKQLGTGPLSARIARPSVATPRRIQGGVAALRRSLPAVAGQEMCSIVPAQSPRLGPVLAMPSNRENSCQRREMDESVETKWRAQFHDRQQPRIEDGHVDRTKVLHNMQKKQLQSGDDQSPLFLWGLPREHILEFIRQSVLPSSWANPKSRPACEWEAVPDEEDEAARIRRVISKALTEASFKPSKKPRAPSPPRSPNKMSGNLSSPHRSGGASPRVHSTIAANFPSSALSSPRSPRVTPRYEERLVRIYKFIGELRSDPVLWAEFQRDVEQIQHQYRLKNYTSDKIRENKERARTPRSSEDHEQRKKQAAERMERTQRQREQILQLEDERMLAKREAYLRRVNPIKQLSAAELELTIPYRRRKIWLHVVSFATISHRWHKQLVQTKQVVKMARMKRTAATTIQRIWRKWKWQHASRHTVVVYTWLRKCLWKMLLRVRCRRKARHATLLRQFVLDHCSESHATRNFKRVMLQWRNKVIRAQRAGLAFTNCNRARLQALSIWWDKVDYERQRLDRQQSSNVDDGRRLTGRKESMRSIGSPPGSAGSKRKSSISVLGGMGNKLASMQMLLTPIELQRLQQNSVQIVKIPKSIKIRLLMELLTDARKDFRRKQQTYKEMILCASYAREVKLEEARAIVQSSVHWDGTAEKNRSTARTGSITSSKSVHPPPCFLLFSDPNGYKTMEALVRRGVQLTLEADPELKALITRQQEHRLQSPHTSPRRPSVSFSGPAVQPSTAPSASSSLSPSPRYSILKKPTQSLLQSSPAIDRPTTPSTATQN